MASIFVLLEAFNRKEAAALGFFSLCNSLIFFAFMKECRYNRAISLKREGFSYGLVHQRRRI